MASKLPFKEMLAKLQESAMPEPIRVACTVVSPGKPEYLGEEYHGRLSKQDDRKLLEGKSGRFIIRDPLGAHGEHEFTLVFNYSGDIQNVRLCYDPTRKTFKTDPSDKEYKSVLSLMSDVLSLFQKLKKTQADISDSSPKNRKGSSKSHRFFQHTYLHPKWCDHCKEFLWGLVNQGYKCEDCGIAVHKFCKDISGLSCSKLALGNKVMFDNNQSSIEADVDRVSLSGNRKRSSIPTFHIKCKYFRSCSQFLSAFNIRDIYIDTNSSLTRCFCTDCFKDNEIDNLNNSSVTYFQNWTMHEFMKQDDPLKRNISDWSIAYLAIKPMYIIELINDFFEPPESNPNIDLLVATSFSHSTEDFLHEDYSYRYVDSRTGNYSYAHSILEVYVQPDSYKKISVCHDDRQFSHCPVIEENHMRIPKHRYVYPKSVLIQIFKEETNGDVAS